MPDRRAFIATVGGAAAAASLLTREADAQTASPAASAAPSASPTPKPPSEAALAIAATMRAFDPKLTDDELKTIASAIDDSRAAGQRLNPKGKTLKNGDEPVTTFHVPVPGHGA